MFEILMFLFENYMDSSVTLKTDNKTIVVELEKIGFDRFDIDRALDWLDGLSQFQQSVLPSVINTKSMRHYLPEEVERLGTAGLGLLIHLEQLKILDPMTREIVIDRIMALEPREIDMGRIHWVVLITLFNQPNKRTALSLLQAMIIADAFDVLH